MESRGQGGWAAMPRKSGYLVMVSDDRSNPFRGHFIRVYCTISKGNLFNCYKPSSKRDGARIDAEKPKDVNSPQRKNGSAPTQTNRGEDSKAETNALHGELVLSVKLAECIAIRPGDFTVEERIPLAKMKLPRTKTSPMSFTIFMHKQTDGRRNNTKGGNYDLKQASSFMFTFTAEAGGEVQSWIRVIQHAMWWTTTVLSIESGRVVQDPDAVVRILLDAKLHPEAGSVSPLIADHLQENTRRSIPRALVCNISLQTCTPALLKLLVTDAIGMPSYMFNFYFMRENQDFTCKEEIYIKAKLVPEYHENQSMARLLRETLSIQNRTGKARITVMLVLNPSSSLNYATSIGTF